MVFQIFYFFVVFCYVLLRFCKLLLGFLLDFCNVLLGLKARGRAAGPDQVFLHQSEPGANPTRAFEVRPEKGGGKPPKNIANVGTYSKT